MKETTNWKIILAILSVSAVMMAASYTMLVPFLPVFLLNDLNVSHDDVKIWTGLIFSASFVMSTIMAPIWGKLSDTKGRKLMAMRASASLAIAYVLGGLCQSPEQLLGVRLIQGLAAGLLPAMIVIISAFLPPDKVGFGLGCLQAGQTTGQAIGPLIGGIMATVFGIRPTFFISAGLLVVITIIILIFIPEPPKTVSSPKEKKTNINLLKRPIILELLCYASLIKLVNMLFQPIIVLYVAEMDPGNSNILFISGLVFSMIGIASAISSPSWGSIGQKYGFYRIMFLSSLLASVAGAVCAFPRTILLFGTAFFIFGLFFSGILPSLNSAIVKEVEPDNRGLAFGYVFSSEKLGSIVGPLIGSIIATYYSMSSVFYACSFFMLFITVPIFILHLRHGDKGLL